jgi:hypothetical protein
MGIPKKSKYDTTSYDDSKKGQETLGAYNTAKENVNNYGDFTYEDYVESDAVKGASDALNAHLATKPGEYTSQWQTQLDDTINKILNREKFTYDLNGDALYQQYKDKHIQQGKMAMGDAIGQASAMTGGYGNSYAQSVGQQMYQKELQNLNDIVPELYQMALDKYSREGQDLYNQFAMLGDRENMDYSRYRDSVADFLTERDYLTGRYDSERGFDYGKYIDDRNMDYTLHQDGYNKLMDFLGIAQGDYYNGADIFHTEQSNKNNIAGREFDEAMAIYNAEYQTSQDSLNRTESNAKNYYETGGKVGYDNGSVSEANIKLMQEALGISADGKWGSGSTEASGGLTADQAWKAYQDGKLGKAEFNYDDFVDDLNYFIKQGADKSEINNYLREALQSGYITQAEYNKLKETYAPRGYTYSTGGGGRTKDTTIAYK